MPWSREPAYWLIIRMSMVLNDAIPEGGEAIRKTPILAIESGRNPMVKWHMGPSMSAATEYSPAFDQKLPYYAHYPLWLILWKPIRKFLNVVLIPNIPFAALRIALYRLLGFKIGKRVFIGMKC